ncbi:hypothetical protein SAMN04488118_10655 [Epibacterium ulvae]|uniref:Uncharacterized protein n=1 Tax=Epibacterium ulvae TaxID=1156985 RepID=A0A1G5QUQ2_9RHOB|nr:hypothetical protein SAMN04488118_10655 [Epibacterium ulvae]
MGAPGHVSVEINNGDRRALITGDAIHTTAQCRYPEWHFKFDSDAEMAVTSRRKLLESASETGCLVLGSNFASFPEVHNFSRSCGKQDKDQLHFAFKKYTPNTLWRFEPDWDDTANTCAQSEPTFLVARLPAVAIVALVKMK